MPSTACATGARVASAASKTPARSTTRGSVSPPRARGGQPTRSTMLSRASYVGTAEPQPFGAQ
jgi:hypothetical protein